MRLFRYWAKITGTSRPSKYHAWVEVESGDVIPACETARFMVKDGKHGAKKVRLVSKPYNCCRTCEITLDRYRPTRSAESR